MSFFGVIFDTDLARHPWPAFGPSDHPQQWLSFRLADVPISLWTAAESTNVNVQMHRRAHPDTNLYRSAWVRYAGPALSADVWTSNASWADLLQTSHIPDLVNALQACVEAVFDSLESNLEDLSRLEGNAKNIRNNWRRGCRGVLRELEEARSGQIFTMRSMEAWMQGVAVTDSWCHLQLPWAEFLRDKAPLKPKNSIVVSQNRSHLLALLRRIMHQNLVYDMLSGTWSVWLVRR